MLRQIVGAVSGCVRFVIDQGVAVTDHASRRVEPGDGQRAAQRRGDRLRETGGDAIGDHGNATDSQRGDAVQCSDGEGAVLRQRRGVRRAAVTEILLVNGQFATVHIEAVDDHRIVVVMDLQHEVRGAGVAVGIGQGVGKGFCAIATAGQSFEIGIAGVQRVGVSAIGVEH